MDGFSFVDIYSTKGIEYLVAVVFFFGFIALQYSLLKSRRGELTTLPASQGTLGTFRVPDGYSFHQGHSWMKAESAAGGRNSVVRVGVNDFAQKLVGKVDAVELPPVGTRIEQGKKAWSLKVDGASIPMLSPVSGVVAAVNDEVLRSPDVLNRDPYGTGWLFHVKSDRISRDTRHLLSGNVARVWMEDALANLFPVDEALGPVMQDGGLPVDGIAKAIGGAQWQDLAMSHLLMTEDD
ncbi:MAG: glycine cleavage system protein H [Deltaproteobacteria bacterium]|nr:glycine cleavage system protein H [Deltaproteobacteria bacterium]